MSVLAEITQLGGAIGGGVAPFLIIWLKYITESKLKTLTHDVKEVKVTVEKIVNRESICNALNDVGNDSIDYTKDHSKINTFKLLFTNAIKLLAQSIITTDFQNLNRAKVEGLMNLTGNQIVEAYKELPVSFVTKLRPKIKSNAEVFYEQLLILVDDTKFNDKDRRFSILVEVFLRDQLMFTTTEYWQYINGYDTNSN